MTPLRWLIAALYLGLLIYAAIKDANGQDWALGWAVSLSYFALVVYIGTVAVSQIQEIDDLKDRVIHLTKGEEQFPASRSKRVGNLAIIAIVLSMAGFFFALNELFPMLRYAPPD